MANVPASAVLDQSSDTGDHKGQRTNRVDVGPEELGSLAPELEDGDAAGALGVGENLDEVGVCQRVEAQIIRRAICITAATWRPHLTYRRGRWPWRRSSPHT